MATQVQRRKGTTVQHSTFTGASAELTVDTTKNTVVVHDGATAGGIPLAKESGSALSPSSLSLPNGTANAVPYLNGSKVLTSGSALTFDGNNLSIGANGQVGSRLSVIANGAMATFNTGAAADGRIEYAYNGTNIFYTGVNSASLMMLMARSGVALGFGANNAEQMRLTSTGLGIGTSSPAYRLQVTTSATGAIARLNTTSGTRGARIEFGLGENAGGAENYIDFSGASGTSAGVFKASGVEVMRLDSSGNLGIGTSSPGEKLDVRSSGNAIGNFQSSNASGYAGINAINGSRSWYAGIRADASNGFGIRDETAGATRLLIDSSGNLGLGVTPSAWSLGKAIEVGYKGAALWGVGSNDVYLTSNINYDGGFKYATTNVAAYYNLSGNIHSWFTAPSGTAGNAITFTQAMTLDASGNLLVGKTATSFTTSGSELRADGLAAFVRNASSATLYVVKPTTTFTTGNMVEFRYNDTVTVGTISYTSTSVAYNTSSDYRLKNITGPITNSGAYIDSLNPVEGTWKVDGSTFVGLIAHEAQEVSRTQVATGTKDGEEMQGMSYSSSEMIANMIAELKALRARVAALEAA